ncbi:MAG: hypothetical protein ACYTGP_11745 [Planctomycetota bacterium]
MSRGARLAVIIVVAGAALAGFYAVSSSAAGTAVELVNASGADVTDVAFILRPVEAPFEEQAIALLPAGESVKIGVVWRDASATLAFTFRGARHQFTEPSIDLWAGDRWRFRILADGRVESGYVTD